MHYPGIEADNGDAYKITPLDRSGFGLRLSFASDDIDTVVDVFSRHAAAILQLFYAARGLMIVDNLQQIRQQPRALVELSRLFGPEVENYRQTLTSPRFFHDTIDEILVLSNAPPCNHPPPITLVSMPVGLRRKLYR